VGAALTLILSSCSVGSPVEVVDRSLSERLADRADDDTGNSAPDALAFGDTLAAGTFLRLDVRENAAEVVLRSGPGDTFREVSTISSGAEVLATGNQNGEWVHVLYAAFEGWIHTGEIAVGVGEPEVVDASEVNVESITYEVVGDGFGVNIRSAAGVQNDLVGGANLGAQVVGTGEVEGGWIEIRHNGVTGWASGRFLRPIDTISGGVAAEPAPAPTVAPAPTTTVAPTTTTVAPATTIAPATAPSTTITTTTAPPTTVASEGTTAPPVLDVQVGDGDG